VRALLFAGVSGLLIALPTRLVPNEFFRRMTPTRPQDYVFWVTASLLFGLVVALRQPGSERHDAAALAGGLGTALAVGCPICNKLVVALLGVSGALNVYAPLQPVLGIASLALLAVALRARLRARATSCRIPAGYGQ
jgi:hypothetical protein